MLPPKCRREYGRCILSSPLHLLSCALDLELLQAHNVFPGARHWEPAWQDVTKTILQRHRDASKGTSSDDDAFLKELLTDVKERCKTGQFKDKTVLFCWEHKNIPYIVARFGLTDHGINWGSNPDSGVGSPIPKL